MRDERQTLDRALSLHSKGDITAAARLYRRIINTNPNKRDEVDVEGMCLLLRLGKLKEVWMGQDRTPPARLYEGRV